MPTLMGYDSDHPRSQGEVGREGVAIDSLEDMETLFARHPARRRLDLDDDQLAGGDPARVLRRASGRSRACRPSICAGRSRRTSSRSTSRRRSRSSRPSRRCGSSPTWSSSARGSCRCGTRSRSPATTSARPARTRPRSSPSRSPTASPTSSAAVERGLDVDDFAPRLCFFFNAHLDFFEEIAKYRAARRIWARELRDRFGATQPALLADALPHPDRRRLADRRSSPR